jgi:hypothetical protein
VQVHGKGVFAEGLHWSELEQLYGRALTLLDQNLDSASEATDRAASELRHAAVEAPEGYIVVPTNCGQQLYDVLDITDIRADLSGAKRRVLGLALTYLRRKRPRYDQRIALGGV